MKEIKIIFIDIDWVLVPMNWNYWWVWNKLDVPIHIYKFMHELYKKWVKFIIHSSWRNFLLDLEEFREYNNLPKYIWNTSQNVSKEKWIEEVLENIYFDIKNKKDIIVKIVVLDDSNLKLKTMLKKYNNEKINVKFIMPDSKKGIIWKEIFEIRNFFNI